MLQDLTALHEKTEALIAAVTRLREENTRLRNQVAQMTIREQAAEQKVALAVERIETLLEKLPQN